VCCGVGWLRLDENVVLILNKPGRVEHSKSVMIDVVFWPNSRSDGERKRVYDMESE